MAPFSSRLLHGVWPLLLILVGAAAAVTTAVHADDTDGYRRRHARLFAFGNSLTDTGNAAIFPATAGGPSTSPPYGETYFGHPSGRASDGRLIVDFLGSYCCLHFCQTIHSLAANYIFLSVHQVSSGARILSIGRRSCADLLRLLHALAHAFITQWRS